MMHTLCGVSLDIYVFFVLKALKILLVYTSKIVIWGHLTVYHMLLYSTCHRVPRATACHVPPPCVTCLCVPHATVCHVPELLVKRLASESKLGLNYLLSSICCRALDSIEKHWGELFLGHSPPDQARVGKDLDEVSGRVAGRSWETWDCPTILYLPVGSGTVAPAACSGKNWASLQGRDGPFFEAHLVVHKSVNMESEMRLPEFCVSMARLSRPLDPLPVRHLEWLYILNLRYIDPEKTSDKAIMLCFPALSLWKSIHI